MEADHPVSGVLIPRLSTTPAVLPEAGTAPMLFWALMASGQIVMRKVDGWETLLSLSILKPLTSPPDAAKPHLPGAADRISTTFATPPARWRIHAPIILLVEARKD